MNSLSFAFHGVLIVFFRIASRRGAFFYRHFHCSRLLLEAHLAKPNVLMLNSAAWGSGIARSSSDIFEVIEVRAAIFCSAGSHVFIGKWSTSGTVNEGSKTQFLSFAKSKRTDDASISAKTSPRARIIRLCGFRRCSFQIDFAKLSIFEPFFQ